MNSKELVRGYIVLRSDQLHPASPETQRLASQSLQAHGLQVMLSSPLSITVEADPETFERTFQAGLSDAGGTVSWSGNPVIPDQLQSLVSDVVFPQSVKLF